MLPNERLHLRNRFFSLSQSRIIPPSDPIWNDFISIPHSASDVFELISSAELESSMAQNSINYAMFVRYVGDRLVEEVRPSSKMSARRYSERRMLNCVRWLTRLVPFSGPIGVTGPREKREAIGKKGAIEVQGQIGSKIGPGKEAPPGPGKKEAPPGPIGSGKKEAPPGPIGSGKKEAPPGPIGPGGKQNGASATTGPKGASATGTGPKGASATGPGPGEKGTPTPGPIGPGVGPIGPDIGTIIDIIIHLLQPLWEPGLGNNHPYKQPDPTSDSHRTELLRLLLTLTSPLHLYPHTVVNHGTFGMTYLVSQTPRGPLIRMICSMVNLICRSGREDNAMVFRHAEFTEVRHLMVTYAFQMLAAMLAYPVPNGGRNRVRGFLRGLKETEALFVASGLMRHLRATLKGPRPSLWALEATVVVWEALQCSGPMREAFIGHYMAELVVVLLFTICSLHNQATHAPLVRISSYMMMYLSQEARLAYPVVERMPAGLYEKVPAWFRTSPPPVTTRDFVVTQMAWICATQPGDRLLATWTSVLYNWVVLVKTDMWEEDDVEKRLVNVNPGGGLSYAASHAVHSLLLAKWATRAFLTDKPGNGDLLAVLMRALATACVKYPRPSRMLLLSVMKNEKVYERIGGVLASLGRDYFEGDTYRRYEEDGGGEGDEEDDDTGESFEGSLEGSVRGSFEGSVRGSFEGSFKGDSAEAESYADSCSFLPFSAIPLTGMSTNAREKLPRASSISRSWAGTDALRVISKILIPHLKSTVSVGMDSYDAVRAIEESDFEAALAGHAVAYDLRPDTPLVLLRAPWTPTSLGWYLSFLYTEVYRGASNVRAFTSSSRLISNITTGIAHVSKLTSSWTAFLKGTDVKKQQEDLAIDRHLASANAALSSVNHWAGSPVFLLDFDTPPLRQDLARRFSRLSVEREREKREYKRDSVVSLHSLNTLNRSYQPERAKPEQSHQPERSEG